MRLVLAGGTLCMALLVGCTGGGGGGPSGAPQSTGKQPTESAPSPRSRSFDVVLIMAPSFGAMAADRTRPRQLARLVHARDCVDWLDPRLRGAVSYEVHLRVRRADAVDAKRSLNAVLGGPSLVGVIGAAGGNRVKVALPSAFNRAPTNMGPRPLRQTC